MIILEKLFQMDKLRFTIYSNSFWYSQKLEIRFYILMMLTRTKRSVTLTAGGLTSCNLDGYKDVNNHLRINITLQVSNTLQII